MRPTDWPKKVLLLSEPSTIRELRVPRCPAKLMSPPRTSRVTPGVRSAKLMKLRPCGETRVLDFDGVGTYRKNGKGKEAVGVASGLKVDGRRIVSSRQFGAGESGTGLIDDDAFDSALIPLRPRRRRNQQKDKKECEASAQESCTRFRNVHSSSPSEGGRDFLRSGPQRRCSGANRDAAKSKKKRQHCARAERSHQRYVFLGLNF